MKQKTHKLTSSIGRTTGRIKARLTSAIAYSILGVVVVATVMSGQANAWGPIRQTFTMKNPADHVAFNAITDDPSWGDERGFTLIKDVTDQANNMDTASAGDFKEVVDAVDGHTYMVKMFVHNNAAANLNLIANNTRVMAYLPTASGDSAMIQGTIAADNCGANTAGATGSACAVWDEAYINSTDEVKSFKVAYVADSARYYNNVTLDANNNNGFTLTDDIVSNKGTLLGYEQMDGRMPGCFQYSGYVTFLVYVTADTTDFTLTKQLRVAGDQEWSHNITAKPGDTIQYRIDYANVGNTQQDDVVIRDTLAKTSALISDDGTTVNDPSTVTGLDYVANSAKLYNASNADGIAVNNDDWTTKGLNIGSYAGGGSNGIVIYETKVPEESELQCGDNVFDNMAMAITEDGSKIATTKVTVHRECTPEGEVPPAEEETPGAPEAGSGIKTAAVSLAAFIVCGAILITVLMKKKASDK